MKNNMKYFVSYKDGPSFEVSADKASEFIDFFGKKYRDDITEVIIEDERKMVSHSFYGHAKDPYGGSIRERTLKEAKDAFKSANVTYGDGRTEGSLIGGSPIQFSLGGLDKCVTTGDGGVYYVGDLFGKGNGKGNGK